MATIGGNLCNGSPKADTAPPLLTYDARIKLVSLKGERILALKDFHSGPNRTIMEANELMTEIQLDEINTMSQYVRDFIEPWDVRNPVPVFLKEAA